MPRLLPRSTSDLITLIFDDIRVDDAFSRGKPMDEVIDVEGGRQVEPRHVLFKEARARQHIVRAQRTEALESYQRHLY